MNPDFILALLWAALWGAVWALFLQMHPVGQWLAMRRTWLTVVIGVGVDLALLLLFLDWHTVAMVTAVVSLSGVGVIVRSLINERKDDVQ